eukprot:scaffold13691_cov156-Amphora_coffeaeformis.AAC.2
MDREIPWKDQAILDRIESVFPLKSLSRIPFHGTYGISEQSNKVRLGGRRGTYKCRVNLLSDWRDK